MEENSRKRIEDCELNLDLNIDINNEANNSKDILSRLASLIPIIAASYAAINRYTNAMFAFNAEDFYKVSADLFYYNTNFEFIVGIIIYISTAIFLLVPIMLKDKWKNKKINFIDSLLYSSLIALHVLILCLMILFDFLVKKFAKRSLICIKLEIVLWYVIIRLIVIFFITGIKPWTKKNNKLVIIDEIKKALLINNFTKVEKVTYGIYIFFYFVAIVYLSSVLTGPNIDPEDKVSYEIIQSEKKFNVIIGHKDGMAITMTSEKAGDPDNKILRFESTEYKLQDLKDKVIIYKSFENVEPFEEVEEKKVESKN